MKETTRINLNRELGQIQRNLESLKHQKGNLYFKIGKLREEISQIDKKMQRLTHRGLEIQAQLKNAQVSTSEGDQ
jgi:predicted  nucleic acid-binding Zn-ribbon protein